MAPRLRGITLIKRLFHRYACSHSTHSVAGFAYPAYVTQSHPEEDHGGFQCSLLEYQTRILDDQLSAQRHSGTLLSPKITYCVSTIVAFSPVPAWYISTELRSLQKPPCDEVCLEPPHQGEPPECMRFWPLHPCKGYQNHWLIWAFICLFRCRHCGALAVGWRKDLQSPKIPRILRNLAESLHAIEQSSPLG